MCARKKRLLLHSALLPVDAAVASLPSLLSMRRRAQHQPLPGLYFPPISHRYSPTGTHHIRTTYYTHPHATGVISYKSPYTIGTVLLPPLSLSHTDTHNPAVSTTLDALLSHLESVPAPTSAFGNDDIWLDIYKVRNKKGKSQQLVTYYTSQLLFLLNTSLPTASDDTIRYWVENRGLLGRVVREAGRAEKCGVRGDRSGVSAQSIAWEVRRLAGELMGVLEDGNGVGVGPGEVRRRAMLF